jgi:trimeric autotransporter adhesin
MPAFENFIGGGVSNTIAFGFGQTIGGGIGNLISQPQSLGRCTIAGGSGNVIMANNQGLDPGDYSTIGGGSQNFITGGFFLAATIAGGISNVMTYGDQSFIGAGFANLIDSYHFSAISGGYSNRIGNFDVDGNYGAGVVIGGGLDNYASQNFGTVGGGRLNSLTGSTFNILEGIAASGTIGGGYSNLVTGGYGTIPGGTANVATNYAFAAGNQAQATNQGAFVWADSQNAPFGSLVNNSVSFRCEGGVRFTSAVGDQPQTVSWTPGQGSWVFSSDCNLKDRFENINPESVLEKVAQLPVVEWSYKGYDQRHIGPMAQDFHALFPLNDNDKVLNELDLHGIELAAIQGLNQKVEDKDHTIEQQAAEISELKARLEKIEQSIASRKGGAQ